MGAVCSATSRSPSPAPTPDDEPVGESTSPRRRSRAPSSSRDEVPLAIDELPLVALLGCFAEGETVVRGAAELRLKESDRIAAVVEGLRGLGADIEATDDGFVVRGGTGGSRGGTIDARGDHRHGDAGRDRRPGFEEGVRCTGWRRPRSRTPASRPTCARWSSPTRASCGRRLRDAPPAKLGAMVIAIDGPAGAGKSTVARALAERSASPTSTPGRCTAPSALSLHERPGDPASARATSTSSSATRVSLDGHDVTDDIRTPRGLRGGVAGRHRPGRPRRARRQAARAAAASGDWVAEGRDIGTVVAPDAALKIFLTPSPEERARRRAAELGQADWRVVLRDQTLRDQQDTSASTRRCARRRTRSSSTRRTARSRTSCSRSPDS